MRRMLITLVGLAGLVGMGGGLGAFVPVQASAGAPPLTHQVTTVPATGALFYPSILGLVPSLGGPHFCTASVVHSATKDLVATAAHCVFGVGATIEFAPLLHGDQLPAGVWTVTKIYIDPAWRKSFDPEHDVAFLRVARRGGKALEDVVPGRRLGTPQAFAPVNVSGYPMGSRGLPLTCDGQLTKHGDYSRIECTGFGNGTSGGPWVQGGRLVGVIGGLEQGGCSPSYEYSTPFGGSVKVLLARATANGPGDFVPIGFSANTCS